MPLPLIPVAGGWFSARGPSPIGFCFDGLRACNVGARSYSGPMCESSSAAEVTLTLALPRRSRVSSVDIFAPGKVDRRSVHPTT